MPPSDWVDWEGLEPTCGRYTAAAWHVGKWWRLGDHSVERLHSGQAQRRPALILFEKVPLGEEEACRFMGAPDGAVEEPPDTTGTGARGCRPQTPAHPARPRVQSSLAAWLKPGRLPR